MTTSLDSELVPEVLALLAEVGKTVVFRVPGTKRYDAVTGTVTNAAPKEYTKKIIPPEIIDAEQENDTEKRAKAKTGVAGSGLEFTPSPKTIIQIDGIEWRIDEANPVYSGDDICLWELVIKR